MDAGITNDQTSSDVVGVPIFPEWREHKHRAIAANDIGDESTRIRRIHETAIWQAKVFARNAAQKLSCSFRLKSSAGYTTTVSHLASGQIYQGEGDAFLL